MKLTIIIIGAEILLGQVTDTNSGEIARALGPKGWEVIEVITVDDNADAIRTAVERALRQSDLVITTGGLGPTKDDITKKTLAELFGMEMIYDNRVLENIEEVFRKRGLELNPLTKDQAWVPNGCRIIQNQLGTAPIMWFEREGKVLISMPGVPFETVGMLEREVVKDICEHFNSDKEFLHHTLLVSRITESALAERLTAFEENLPENVHLAYLPVPGYIRLRLDGTFKKGDELGKRVYGVLCTSLCQLVGENLLYDGDATPAEILLSKLRDRHLTLATAESCTGGNIAHTVTEIAGASEVYMGSVISYSNDVKHRVLGVRLADLEQHGAVSEPVVRQMAEGAARVISTDCAVATSGIAGPGGGTPDKPVGTVWIAARCNDRLESRLLHLPGSRHRIIDRATTEALLLLLSIL